MKVLGLDIGTTTISAVVWEEGRGVLTAKTVASESFLPAGIMKRGASLSPALMDGG